MISFHFPESATRQNACAGILAARHGTRIAILRRSGRRTRFSGKTPNRDEPLQKKLINYSVICIQEVSPSLNFLCLYNYSVGKIGRLS